jgi:hypothetical protein
MDATDLAEMDAAFTDLFRQLAGDPITTVGSDGQEAEFTGFRWEPDSDTSPFEGLQIDASGMRDQQEDLWLLLKSDLAAKSWDLDATDHFIVDGKRWDLSKDKPTRRSLAPLGGWQGLIMITIREAVEINKSATGTAFTYEP